MTSILDKVKEVSSILDKVKEVTSVLDKAKEVTSIFYKVKEVTSILHLSVHWSSNKLVWDVHHWLNWKKENVLNLPTNQFLCATSPHKNSLSLSNFPAFVKRHREARKARKIREKKTKGNFVFYFVFYKTHTQRSG